ncbi:hypothetical protein CFOL_v3_32808, partial [Cephalotus follicularis]
FNVVDVFFNVVDVFLK